MTVIMDDLLAANDLAFDARACGAEGTQANGGAEDLGGIGADGDQRRFGGAGRHGGQQGGCQAGADECASVYRIGHDFPAVLIAGTLYEGNIRRQGEDWSQKNEDAKRASSFLAGSAFSDDCR